MAKSTKTVFCSCGCSVKSMGVKTSYPTDPGVERRGVIAFIVSFWKRVFSSGGFGGPPNLDSSRVPLTQKSLPVPSCRDALHTCALFVGPGRRLSGFWSFGLDVSLPEVLPEYPL